MTLTTSSCSLSVLDWLLQTFEGFIFTINLMALIYHSSSDFFVKSMPPCATPLIKIARFLHYLISQYIKL